jgi:hypothetical protein
VSGSGDVLALQALAAVKKAHANTAYPGQNVLLSSLGAGLEKLHHPFLCVLLSLRWKNVLGTFSTMSAPEALSKCCFLIVSAINGPH